MCTEHMHVFVNIMQLITNDVKTVDTSLLIFPFLPMSLVTILILNADKLAESNRMWDKDNEDLDYPLGMFPFLLLGLGTHLA